jgi:hypothetical protein
MSRALEFGLDLGGSFGVGLHHRFRHPGDGPVPEAAGGPGVGDNGVAQLDRSLSGGHPADHGGGVQMLPPQGGVGRLPATLVIRHADDVGHQHVVVGTRVAGPGGGVAGDGTDHAFGLRALHGSATAPADGAGQLVEVGHRGVALGVHDGVHVLGPADDSELGDRLVGRDDQLQAGPLGRDQPLAGRRVTGAAWAEQGLVLGVGDGAL